LEHIGQCAQIVLTKEAGVGIGSLGPLGDSALKAFIATGQWTTPAQATVAAQLAAQFNGLGVGFHAAHAHGLAAAQFGEEAMLWMQADGGKQEA